MRCKPVRALSRARQNHGMTLPEMMIAAALASLLLAGAGSLWLFGGRSLAAMANYTDLDAKSRHALDLMSRDIREADQVMGCYNSGQTNWHGVKWLSVTNTAQGTGATYIWNPKLRTLVCRKDGQADQVYLTECDSWDFDLYQRAPQKSGSYVFWPATNKVGAYDLSICKLINMTWKCSRTILGSKLNTESVQTAQVVLRNKQ
jgi:prepilin-type N-terminal cleavage/methylation domain-containing protein